MRAKLALVLHLGGVGKCGRLSWVWSVHAQDAGCILVRISGIRGSTNTASIMKSYFHLLVVVHGLFVSDSPCISVPSVSIGLISVAISNPMSMLVPCMFWKPKRVNPSLCCLSIRGLPVAGMLVRSGHWRISSVKKNSNYFFCQCNVVGMVCYMNSHQGMISKK